MMQLLAVACLSLGAKVDETDVPLSLDLQVSDSKPLVNNLLVSSIYVESSIVVK